MAEHF